MGTFHHLYFTGTPTAVLALGASFSALEVVPLVLMGFEAYENLKLSRATSWLRAYKWPIYCFIAVAFWDFLGAGIFGFLINGLKTGHSLKQESDLPAELEIAPI